MAANQQQSEEVCDLKLTVNADLFKAFQRCSWIIVNETGRTRIDIMNEMVRDFLVKHAC